MCARGRSNQPRSAPATPSTNAASQAGACARYRSFNSGMSSRSLANGTASRIRNDTRPTATMAPSRWRTVSPSRFRSAGRADRSERRVTDGEQQEHLEEPGRARRWVLPDVRDEGREAAVPVGIVGGEFDDRSHDDEEEQQRDSSRRRRSRTNCRGPFRARDGGVKAPAIRKNVAMPNKTPTSEARLNRVSRGSRTGGSRRTHPSFAVHAATACAAMTPTTSHTFRSSAHTCRAGLARTAA